MNQQYKFFIWKHDKNPFGELAKSFEIQKNNTTIPPNYRTFVRQIIVWTASFLAVTRSDDKLIPIFES